MNRVVGVVVALLAVAFVALSATGAVVYWNRVEQQGEQQTRAELPGLAVNQVPLILGFDYQTILATRMTAYDLMTPTLRSQYEDDTTKTVIPQAHDRQLISQVNVVGAGILDAQRNSGSVLVFMNRVLTDKSKQSLYDGSRLKVDYRKVDGKWLIDAMKPI